MSKDHNIYHNSTVTVDKNPLNSKLLRNTANGILEGEDPLGSAFKVTKEIVNQIYDGIQLNLIDIPCYLLALDTIKQSLMTLVDEQGIALYEILKKHAQVATFHIDKDKTEEDSDE